MLSMKHAKNTLKKDGKPSPRQKQFRVELYGEEVVEKVVKASGNSGRVYLPPMWAGCRVRIIKID